MSKRKMSELLEVNAAPDDRAAIDEALIAAANEVATMGWPVEVIATMGWPVEVTETPDAESVAEAVDLLRRCHPFVAHDMLAQQVHAFVKAHGG